MLYLSLVMTTQGGGSCSGSISGTGTELISEQKWEFILLNINRLIMDQTPMIFGSIIEKILKILDAR